MDTLLCDDPLTYENFFFGAVKRKTVGKCGTKVKLRPYKVRQDENNTYCLNEIAWVMLWGLFQDLSLLFGTYVKDGCFDSSLRLFSKNVFGLDYVIFHLEVY